MKISINKQAVAVSILSICAAIALSIFFASRSINESIQLQALENARTISHIVHMSRQIYSSEAVDRVKQLDSVAVSNRYRDYHHGIPNPATYTMLLADHISAQGADKKLHIQMYSDLPFNPRAGRKLDQFGAAAIRFVRDNPGQSYAEIETVGDDRILRFADPMVMKQSCVNCHQVHPDSPKRDWQVGDIRGVLEVSQSLHNDSAIYRNIARYQSSYIAIAVLLCLGLAATLVRFVSADRRVEAAVELANTDSLTNLHNRRAFDRAFATTMQASQDQQVEFSVILFDIDFFKAYNDSYGHLKGDETLQRVAQTLQQAMARSVDQVARYGGEEFAIVLPATGREVAQAIAERARAAVENLGIEHRASASAGIVTVSAGSVTVAAASRLSAKDILRRADAALYQAKRNGRNRSVSTSA